MCLKIIFLSLSCEKSVGHQWYSKHPQELQFLRICKYHQCPRLYPVWALIAFVFVYSSKLQLWGCSNAFRLFSAMSLFCGAKVTNIPYNTKLFVKNFYSPTWISRTPISFIFPLPSAIRCFYMTHYVYYKQAGWSMMTSAHKVNNQNESRNRPAIRFDTLTIDLSDVVPLL